MVNDWLFRERPRYLSRDGRRQKGRPGASPPAPLRLASPLLFLTLGVRNSDLRCGSLLGLARLAQGTQPLHVLANSDRVARHIGHRSGSLLLRKTLAVGAGDAFGRGL